MSLVDAQGSTVEILAVQRAHGRLAFSFVRHFDEREAAGSAGEAISNDGDTRNRAVLAEQVSQALLGRLETQITHVDTEHEEVLPSWEPANGHERTEQANPNKNRSTRPMDRTIDRRRHQPNREAAARPLYPISGHLRIKRDSDPRRRPLKRAAPGKRAAPHHPRPGPRLRFASRIGPSNRRGTQATDSSVVPPIRK